MRLINADSFLKQYSDQVRGDTIDAIDLRLALLKEPKVDAIPVKWIKKQIEKYATFEFHLDVDDIEARACLEYLLEDWEKENE